ncbi:hypothetical protein DPMN_170390 [Dreissena polymorpha]|uniref:Uncharacterized protein n=1 Tax=Dreissena polymorpha TaxID=45954 RepID=A0A9D4DZP5_DREPO|nr:hypothetical protein DPMN_170390 [Dreissena polymorpha]
MHLEIGIFIPVIESTNHTIRRPISSENSAIRGARYAIESYHWKYALADDKRWQTADSAGRTNKRCRARLGRKRGRTGPNTWSQRKHDSVSRKKKR